MPFDCVVSAVETIVTSNETFECSVRTAFIEYLKERHDLLMYQHAYMFSSKHLDPTEIAMQLTNGTPSSLYFSDLTFFLLMDALHLKGTLFTPAQSTSSYRFTDQNSLSINESDVMCVVASRCVYVINKGVVTIGCCPLMDFLKRKYSVSTAELDIYVAPRVHVVGFHGAGEFISYLHRCLS